MNNLSLKLHRYQNDLLRKLTYNRSLKFNDLLIEGLESEHMNYHLKKLLGYGLVEKNGLQYVLTDSGKDYVNLLDDNVEIVEKQPKTSILLNAIRVNENGELEYLLTKRLREPYYGKVGRLTGKVRFGETFDQAGARELFEETGLVASNYQLEKVYRKMRYDKSKKYVQDVVFYILLVTDFSGQLIEETSSQLNFWATKEATLKRDDLFDDIVLDSYQLKDGVEVAAKELVFEESLGEAEGF